MQNTACAALHAWGRRQLKQPSTWRGLAFIATALGANISPELAHQIVAVGVSVAGAIDVMKNDAKAP